MKTKEIIEFKKSTAIILVLICVIIFITYSFISDYMICSNEATMYKEISENNSNKNAEFRKIINQLENTIERLEDLNNNLRDNLRAISD